jgi:uncharacterized protein YyaL (SSP411 family)
MKTRHLKEDGTPKYTNRLSSETSPYLLQHAHNPVDWYPWGPEALAKARSERRPVHLSIGYSACHWCHVLAAESFEDEATAALLNERFVNIKVDREERPDLDRIYQIAQQLLTRHPGGWPLTMFLTHDDQRPFFGGTYFPPQARHGLPAFRDVLARVAEYYATHATELREQGAALMEAFAALAAAGAAPDGALTAEPIAAARRDFAATFDRQFGGFGAAPKFPHPLALERLLRGWHATARHPQPDLESLYMAALTLRRMGEGGINDQLGGGFCRYSVDPYWMIPHFEKMLYDNGALLAVYAQAALATGDPFYARIAGETAEFMQREMQGPDGGFYSSFDADSEGHEGKYYVWDRAEIEGALTGEEFAAFAPRFGLDREANFEGRWHLHAFESLEDVAARLGKTREETTALVDSARRKLLAIRARRVPPGRDDKVLTAWNALAIRGLAIAARCLARDDFAACATRALDFIRGTLWRDGRLLATSKDGRAHLNAYLDDYAYLADAVLELQQVRYVGEEVEFARALAETLLARFADPAGGFYFTSDDHEALILRSKSFSDDATPAGNGIAAFVLQRLGYLLAEPRYLEAAERTLRAAWPALTQHAPSHAALLAALEEHVAPPEIVVLRGPEAEIDAWRRALAQLYAPRRLVLAIANDEKELPAALADKTARSSTVGYVCVGNTCSAPIDSLRALTQALESAQPAPAT